MNVDRFFIIVICVLATLLSACSPTFSKVTKQGGTTDYHKLEDGKAVNYDCQYWSTDKGLAVLAIWDANSDKYRDRFQWNYVHDYHLRQLTFWNTNNAVTFTSTDKLKPDTCFVVFGDNGNVKVEQCSQREAVQLWGKYSGRAY